MEWNIEQATAIKNSLYRRSFNLIGAAGTGKTTTLKGAARSMLAAHTIPILTRSTAVLSAGTPGIVLLSYTRRAVRNIARQMDDQLKSHCCTFHKLLEFTPEFYTVRSDTGELVEKMRFAPQRNAANKLPAELKTIIVDESSMVATDLFERLLDALVEPSQVQFIFLGDLNQLPPVYGQPILAKKLIELETVELTRVYRQALESPIVSLALAVKDNSFAQFNKDAVELWGAPRLFDVKHITEKITLERQGRGKVTIFPWKQKVSPELALRMVKQRMPQWIEEGFYLPNEDMILSPYNEWCNEISKAVADHIGKKANATVFEIIAGFQKYYYAVGDKLMVDKQDAIILDIYRNPKYYGAPTKVPSKTLSRWGKDTEHENETELGMMDIDDALAALAAQDVEDRTAQSSHIIKVRMIDTDEEVLITQAAVLNKTVFGYAMTVHKAQGSEARKVFFLTDYSHAHMLSRELVYTAITRAAEELVILCSPKMLATSAAKPRIKGNTLAEKIAFFTQRQGELL